MTEEMRRKMCRFHEESFDFSDFTLTDEGATYKLNPSHTYFNINTKNYNFQYDSAVDMCKFCIYYINENEYDMQFTSRDHEVVLNRKDLTDEDERQKCIIESRKEYEQYDDLSEEEIIKCMQFHVPTNILSDDEYCTTTKELCTLPKSFMFDGILYKRFVLSSDIDYFTSLYKPLCTILIKLKISNY